MKYRGEPAMFIIAPLVSAPVVLLEQPWTKIVVRVAGSWGTAVGMLMLGWMMRGRETKAPSK